MAIKIVKTANWVAGQGTKFAGDPALGGSGAGKSYSGGAAPLAPTATWTVDGSVHASLETSTLPAIPNMYTLETSFDVGTITSGILSYSNGDGSERVYLQSGGGLQTLPFDIAAHYQTVGYPSSGHDLITLSVWDNNLSARMDYKYLFISGITNSANPGFIKQGGGKA